MPIGWGIVGLGHHPDTVTAPILNKLTNTKLVAVCRRNTELAREFATKHGAERAYDSLDKMQEDSEIDVLYIATPHNVHAQQAIQAAEAGKHVLCEKPIALTVADGELMIEAFNRSKVKLGVCCQERYHPAHIEARRYIESGIAGEINVVKAQFCRGNRRGASRGWRNDPNIAGAGALYGQAIHPIDLLRFLLDSEVEEVRALTDEEPPRYPVDDMVYVIIKFENGVHGMLLSGVLAHRSDNDAVLYGSKAKITCKGTIGAPGRGHFGELLVDGDSLNLTMTFPMDNPLTYRMTRIIEDFNKWIEEGIEPQITGYNGLQMVKIANAILESSRQGRAVKIEKK